MDKQDRKMTSYNRYGKNRSNGIRLAVIVLAAVVGITSVTGCTDMKARNEAVKKHNEYQKKLREAGKAVRNL